MHSIIQVDDFPEFLELYRERNNGIKLRKRDQLGGARNPSNLPWAAADCTINRIVRAAMQAMIILIRLISNPPVWMLPKCSKKALSQYWAI